MSEGRPVIVMRTDAGVAPQWARLGVRLACHGAPTVWSRPEAPAQRIGVPGVWCVCPSALLTVDPAQWDGQERVSVSRVLARAYLDAQRLGGDLADTSPLLAAVTVPGIPIPIPCRQPTVAEAQECADLLDEALEGRAAAGNPVAYVVDAVRPYGFDEDDQ